MKISRFVWITVTAFMVAAILKFMLVYYGVVPFNADEAVVALMARHILQGARPVFFYGQAYMGSLDAFLVAMGFSLLGQQVWVIRLVQGLLYIGVLGTTAWLGKEAFGSWQVGGVAALMLAIPTVNVTLYTTVSLGGYGEALLLGNLTLLCGMRIAKNMSANSTLCPWWMWFVWGFLAGLGLWAFGLSLVYSLPMGLYLIWKILLWIKSPLMDGEGETNLPGAEIEDYGTSGKLAIWPKAGQVIVVLCLVLMGSLVGSAPWWGYALENGFGQLLWELRGGAIAGVEGLPWLLQVGRHIYSFILLGITVIFGFRPPWRVSWLAWPLLPFVLFFWMAVIVHIIRSVRNDDPGKNQSNILVGIMLTLLIGFVFTPFGADPSGRYFVPLAVPLALFAADMIIKLVERFGFWAWSLIILVLIYQLWGTVQVGRSFPPGITTQFYEPSQVDHLYMPDLIKFLNQQGENRGYSNYWVSYPLAFLSDEELIFVPRLPYHLDFRYTDRDDRYLPYGEEVTQADQVAYITTNHEDLDDYLRTSFTQLGVTWEEVQIGDYHVFYHLSRVVRPNEISLGSTKP